MASAFSIHIADLRRVRAALADVDVVAFEKVVEGLRDGQAAEDLVARIGLAQRYVGPFKVLAELCYLADSVAREDGLPVAVVSTGAIQGRTDAEWTVFAVPRESDVQLIAEDEGGAEEGLSTVIAPDPGEDDVLKAVLYLLVRISPRPLRWPTRWVLGYSDPDTWLTIRSRYFPGIARRLHQELDAHRTASSVAAR